jgi:hypothetical protein
VDDVVSKYRQKGILIDANLLLGYLIGQINPSLLARCRATTRYFGPDGFPLLDRFLRQFTRCVTTPHILTEVSNLAGRLPESFYPDFRALFRSVIGRLFEESKPSRTISGENDFIRFGLTDTAISLVAAGKSWF